MAVTIVILLQTEVAPISKSNSSIRKPFASNSAFNALLKTLEEPPSFVVFILCTTEPQKIIPTILSRVQRFDFSKVTKEDLVANMRRVLDHEGIGYQEEALKAIASLSDGGVRDSLSLLDQLVSYAENKITIDDVDNLFGLLSIKDELRLVSLIESRKTDECLHLVREKYAQGMDILRLHDDLITIFKDLAIYQATRDESLLTKLAATDCESLSMPLRILRKDIDALLSARREYRHSESLLSNLELAILALTDDSPSETATFQKVETSPAPKAEKEKAEAEKAAQEGKGKEGDNKAKTPARTTTNAKGTANAKTPNPKFKGYSGEVTLFPDSMVEVLHNQKSRKIRVTAVDTAGRRYPIKYKRLSNNKIRILNLDSVKLRVNVMAKPKLEEKPWFPYLQGATRFLMMVRNVSVSYRNTYAMSLPGFLPNVGDMLGQRTGGGMMSPGLDFAFGMTGDSYIDKANERGWLLNNDSISTPATTNAMEDLQIKAVLEPIPDLKIDLNASRTMNSNKSIQYMYAGMPTTQSGSFTMTTISIKSAFESRGDASNGYSSKTFTRFQQYLNTFQRRVEARYANATYPAATGLQGKFDPANGTVNKYSADVMIPAFLAAYTGGSDINSPLDIFPSLARMLPNWTVSYKGLGYLPWIRDHFKSVTLNHSYKSVYSVGSYNTYSSWMEYMGDLGFIQNTTDNSIVPSSMYDISSVSINEAFSPLAGLDMTLNNNMTFKVEYRKTRVLTLSMTAAQLNEACSNDFVIGWGYKINDFKLSSLFGGRRARRAARARNNNQNNTNTPNARNNNRSNQSKNSRAISHDLNLRFDFSFRNQDAITRNIQTSLSEATSGNKAVKASFSADYTMSRYVTLSLYYDRQRNQPLLSSNAYPTITQDFGFSLRFSLTR